MVLKLYGVPFSTCTQRVGLVLKEKNVPFELIEIDFRAGQHKSPEFMKFQPFGCVPYIDDDGFILYESRAIGRYIATKYATQGTPLIPTVLQGIALFEQAASIETANFEAFVAAILAQTVFNHSGAPPDENIISKNLQTLERKLDVYNVILGKQKYLGGDELTLADLFHIPHANTLINKAHIDPFSSRPNVARWYKDITSRPSWQEVKVEVKSTA